MSAVGAPLVSPQVPLRRDVEIDIVSALQTATIPNRGTSAKVKLQKSDAGHVSMTLLSEDDDPRESLSVCSRVLCVIFDRE